MYGGSVERTTAIGEEEEAHEVEEQNLFLLDAVFQQDFDGLHSGSASRCDVKRAEMSNRTRDRCRKYATYPTSDQAKDSISLKCLPEVWHTRVIANRFSERRLKDVSGETYEKFRLSSLLILYIQGGSVAESGSS